MGINEGQFGTVGASGKLREMPPGMRGKISGEIERMYRGVPSAGKRALATRRAAVERTVRLYGDLWALGYTCLKLENLKSSHLQALMQLWRHGRRDAQGTWERRPMSRAAASNLWTIVRRWVKVLGKQGMAPAFGSVWPIDQVPPQERREGLRQQATIAELGEGTYQAILASWRLSPAKRTHYWVLRAMRELGLASREALALKPYTASLLRPGNLVIRRIDRPTSRLVALDTDAKRELVRDLGRFTESMRRDRLGWPLKEVGDDEAADRRLRKAVYYTRDRLARGSPATAAPVAEGEPT